MGSGKTVFYAVFVWMTCACVLLLASRPEQERLPVLPGLLDVSRQSQFVPTDRAEEPPLDSGDEGERRVWVELVLPEDLESQIRGFTGLVRDSESGEVLSPMQAFLKEFVNFRKSIRLDRFVIVIALIMNVGCLFSISSVVEKYEKREKAEREGRERA